MHLDAHALIRIRIGLLQAAGQNIHGHLRLLDLYSRLQSADTHEPTLGFARTLLIYGYPLYYICRSGTEQIETRRQDSYDGYGVVIDKEATAQNFGVAGETALPEFVGDGHPAPVRPVRVVLGEQTA